MVPRAGPRLRRGNPKARVAQQKEELGPGPAADGGGAVRFICSDRGSPAVWVGPCRDRGGSARGVRWII